MCRICTFQLIVDINTQILEGLSYQLVIRVGVFNMFPPVKHF